VLLNPPAWDGFQALEKRLGFESAVGFDGADDDIGTSF
jgi:hypothetical protein